MKKLLIALGLVLGLCASTTSRGWSQGLNPWHIDTYEVTSTVGSFLDISTNPNAVALGESLTAGSDLLNKTFARTLVHDTTYKKYQEGDNIGQDSVTPAGNRVVDHITDRFTDDVTVHSVTSALMITENNRVAAGFPLGFEFDLCGRKMTHFTVSAFGGIWLRDDSLQPEYPSYLASVGRWGIFAQPYLSASATGAPAMASAANKVLSPATGAPAYYLIDGEEGSRVLTVQHHYQVRGTATAAATDEWTFQFKFYEGSNKIEFIVKELEYANALSGNHRIAICVTDYAAYPTLDAAGNTWEPQDPYKNQVNTFLNIMPKGSNHRVYVGQTDAMSTAKGWDTLATWGAAQTMRIDADHHPEPGRTIAFTPKEAPATADITPFSADYYTIKDETATATTYNSKIYYNATMFTQQAFHEAGPIVAVISENEIPDYTLENGRLYAKGDKLKEGEGFQPQVIAVSQSKSNPASMTWQKENDMCKLPTSNFEVTLTATGLEKAHVYYLHVYRMAYAGTTAPSYSAPCFTRTFTTDFAEPKQFTQVGLADIDKVTLKAEPADGLSVLIVKSKDLDLKPSGILKKGDKIGDNAEVLELLSEEKTWDLPLAYGEGCFIVAYSVNTDDPDHYIYAPTKKYFSVGTAYKELPGLVDFSGCAYGVPNFEYNGIDMKTRDYGERLQPTIARDLPFGYSRTPYTGGTQQRCFGLGKPGARTPVSVYAYVVPDVDFITPPIVANKDRILMTFNANWVNFDDFGGSYDNFTVPNSNSNVCTIQYAIEDGDWVNGVSYKGSDDIFATRDDNGYYPISFSLIADEGDTFIGKKIRFRLISNTLMQGSMGAAIYLIIPSVDIKEDKICKTPTNVAIVDSLTTTTQIALDWHDENLETQPANQISYHINYKEATDTTDNWIPKSADDTVGVVNGLSPMTQYAFRISTDCGAFGTSYVSKTYVLSSIHTFPYEESMATDTGHFEVIGGSNAYIPGPDPFARGVKAATGALRDTNTVLTMTNGANTSFNISAGWQKLVEYRRVPQSLGVRETAGNAWLIPAPVYIKEFSQEFGEVYPQVIRFKANCAYMSASEPWTKGSLGSRYAEATLYVLLSYGGDGFTWQDTLATIAVGAETVLDRAFEIEVPDSIVKEGRADVAFYFYNPRYQTGNAEYDDFMLFEIYDFEYTYGEDVCLPIDNLIASNMTTEGATLTWEGTSDHYKVSWGEDYGDYTNSITTTETTYTLTGLKDYTRYYVKVEGYCDEAETLAAPGELTTWFMTFEACHIPTEFAVADITSSGATFTSTDEQEIMTKRLIYLTPEEGDTVIVIAQSKDTLAVTNLLDKMVYVAQTRAVCDKDSSDFSEPITFTTLADTFEIRLLVEPDDAAGTVDGAGLYEKGEEVTIVAMPADDYDFIAWVTEEGFELSTNATYTFKAEANVTYTARFEEKSANEAAIKAAFDVSTKNGHLIIRNLKGLTVNEVVVYGLTGRQLGYFTPNSREDLALPINAERALLLVRVASEQGVAIYKVYLH